MAYNKKNEAIIFNLQQNKKRNMFTYNTQSFIK